MLNETPSTAARRLAQTVMAKGFKPEALHVYHNCEGQPLYWRMRLKHPQTRAKWIRPFHQNQHQAFVFGEPTFPHKKPLYGDIEIYSDYRRLWVIEESFRISKHNLKMRPIYHFTPKPIQAHILLCYMVFTLMRHIQFKLQQSKQTMSVSRIVDAVRDIQASILVDTTNQKKYRMLSTLDEDASILYKLFNIEQGTTIMALS